MGSYDHDDRYERARRENQFLKKRLLESIDLLRNFRRAAYTAGIDHELNSIEKFYKANLYDLRHINIDTDSV